MTRKVITLQAIETIDDKKRKVGVEYNLNVIEHGIQTEKVEAGKDIHVALLAWLSRIS